MKISSSPLTQSDKDKYRDLCEKESIPLFMQAWWMDAVCVKGSWEVFLYEKDGEVIAAMPFHVRKKIGLKFIVEPQLTQYSGIWIKELIHVSFQKTYSLEKEVCNYFMDRLEKYGFVYYHQTFHFSFTNWQPLYWKGFEQTTRYTYVIKNIIDTENVFKRFDLKSKQKQIQKAKVGFIIDFSLSDNEFYIFHKNSLRKKQKKILYSFSLFQSIYKASTDRGQGQLIAIRDSNNNLHAALFVVWDKLSGYNLINAIDPQFKSSRASTRLIWEVICFLSNKTQDYDFEGSMIEGVAYRNQQLGAELRSYFKITKSYSCILEWLINR